MLSRERRRPSNSSRWAWELPAAAATLRAEDNGIPATELAPDGSDLVAPRAARHARGAGARIGFQDHGTAWRHSGITPPSG